MNSVEENGFYIRSDGYFRAFMGAVDIGDAILKAEQKGSTKVFPFRGTASTPDKDREGEIVLQKGLNFSPFKEFGEYNWNHISHAIVGVPTGKKAWMDEGIWKSQGEIISGLPIWEGYTTDMMVAQHNQLKKAGFNRGLCQSVEGRVTKRSDNGKYVAKADVYNIALTFRPINPNCSIVMLEKSLRGEAPVLCRDLAYEEMDKSLSVSSVSSFANEDLEGAEKKTLDKRLIRHLMKKGHSELSAKRHVYKYLSDQENK